MDCCDETELDNDKAKILFFYSFPKEHIQDYVYHGNFDFDLETFEDHKNFFQGNYDANPPKKTDKQNVWHNKKGQSSCLLLSFLVTMMMPPPHLLLHPIVVPMTDLAIVLALVNNVTPAHHVPVINVDSAKTTQSSRMIVKCTTLPLVHRWPKMLTICTSLHNPPNIVQLLLCPHVVPICCHAAIMSLSPLIILMIVAAPQNAAAPIATLTAILAAMTTMMMIDIVIAPLVLALTIIS